MVIEMDSGVFDSSMTVINTSLHAKENFSDYHVYHGETSSMLDYNGSAGDNTSSITPTYYSHSFRIIAATLGTIIFTVGFVGNSLVVIVIARTRSMHTPTNCYLLSLAVADCIVLISATLPSIPEPFFQIDEWPFGRVLCSVLIFLQYVGVNASSLSITAFTVERYIAICHPMRAQTICTFTRAKRIIGGLWLLTIMYCSPWLGLTELKRLTQTDGYTIEKCKYRLERTAYLTYYMTDLIIFYVIPFFIAVILYCLIGRILFMSTLPKTLERNTRNGSDSTRRHNSSRIQVRPIVERRCTPMRDSIPAGEKLALTLRYIASGDSYQSLEFLYRIPKNTICQFVPEVCAAISSVLHKDYVQVVRMLIVVVFVFATLWMPYRVMVVYNSFAKQKYMDLWFLLFCRTMVYINSAINPILYNAMSVKFRRAFKNHLCCGDKHSQAPVYLYSEMATESVGRRQTVLGRPSHDVRRNGKENGEPKFV